MFLGTPLNQTLLILLYFKCLLSQMKLIEIIFSEFFAVVSHTAFTLNAPPIETRNDLEKKVVGMIRDFDTWNNAKRLNLKQSKLVRAATINTLVSMLYAGRIDVAIHDQHDFLRNAEHLGYPSPVFNQQSVIWRDNLGFVCHNSEKNKAFIKKINPSINHLQTNQTLTKLYQAYDQRQ